MRISLTFDECEHLLRSEHYGHLGCCKDSEPFVFPVTYAYRNGYLYSHTREGSKIDMLRKNPHVCLQVESVQTGYDWESVMCHGTFEELTDANERHEVELMLADQYAAISLKEGKIPVSPVTDMHRETVEDLKQSVIYRIDIKSTTGVREKKS